jgi:hypothetical protein
MNRAFRPLLACLLLLPLASFAAETGWMEPETGFEDKTSGAKVQSITPANEGAEQIITIAIPKKSIKSREGIEEIIVIGRRPKEKEFKIPFSYEWAKDFEGDYYGLILKIGKEATYPIRLYLKDEDSNKVVP